MLKRASSREAVIGKSAALHGPRILWCTGTRLLLLPQDTIDDLAQCTYIFTATLQGMGSQISQTNLPNSTNGCHACVWPTDYAPHWLQLFISDCVAYVIAF